MKAEKVARLETYIAENVNTVYTSSYDETITDKQAQLLLSGDFEAFDEEMCEIFSDWDDQGYLWSDWESELAREFGFDSYTDIAESRREWIEDRRILETADWIKDAIKHWDGNITATIHKPARKGAENYIFAPSSWTDRDGFMDSDDIARARYLMDAFGIKITPVKGTSKAAQLVNDLEVVYGGYDREQLTLCGRLDLYQIYEDQKAPAFVTVGPEDADNLIFYLHDNGCGSMGEFKLTRTRTMPATLHVDGTYGYGVDSCYGFTGEYWRHPIRATYSAKGVTA